MTPAPSETAALGWLAAMTPGLRAAALVDGTGRVVAGDEALGAAPPRAGPATAPGGTRHVVRGARLTLVARVDEGAPPGLLAADLATALAVAEGRRGA